MDIRKIDLHSGTGGRFAGSRFSAMPLRQDLEEKLVQSRADLVLDFSGMSATQSFVDELVGVLVLRQGPDILKRLIFKGCSEDVRAIIRFVVIDRYDQYVKQHLH